MNMFIIGLIVCGVLSALFLVEIIVAPMIPIDMEEEDWSK